MASPNLFCLMELDKDVERLLCLLSKGTEAKRKILFQMEEKGEMFCVGFCFF